MFFTSLSCQRLKFRKKLMLSQLVPFLIISLQLSESLRQRVREQVDAGWYPSTFTRQPSHLFGITEVPLDPSCWSPVQQTSGTVHRVVHGQTSESLDGPCSHPRVDAVFLSSVLFTPLRLLLRTYVLQLPISSVVGWQTTHNINTVRLRMSYKSNSVLLSTDNTYCWSNNSLGETCMTSLLQMKCTS